MKRILFTTDFSIASEKAIRYILNLLGNHASEFTFLHSYYSFQGDNLAEASFQSFETIYSRSKTKMKQLILKAQELDNNHIHTFKSILLPLSPAGVLHFLRYQRDFDLVVAGTTSKQENTFFGNIATDIVRNVPANSVIVPEKVNNKPLNNVLMAIEGQADYPLKELSDLKTILQKNAASLILLNVVKSNHDCIKPLPTYEYHYFFNDIEIIDYTICARSVKDGITKYLNFHETDMLVTITRQRSFFEGVFNRSLSSKLALNPSVPLMNIYNKSTANVNNKEKVSF
ncbi:universal stress protein [Emticicia fontis]